MTRRNELDATRGLLLLVMAMTHLPTGLNSYADQPLGFVSAAEGFVFLSAFLVGSIYSPLLLERGIAYVRERLWKRARRLYAYHLALLVFAFTIVAALAHLSHSAALHNYLLVFFQAPGWAVLTAPLFLYQPPLLDILPMYIVFLTITPLLLRIAARRGWWPLLTASGLLWLCAQLHSDGWMYRVVRLAHLPLPRDAWSAFDWLGWQLVWIGGLWLGSRQLRRRQASAAGSRSRVGTYLLAIALPTTLVLLLARHHLGGLFPHLDINSPLVDKWKLGPLRVANFAALGMVMSRLLLPALRWLRIGVLELLGRASLQVFTAHIPVCILADGLIGAGSVGLPVTQQALLLVLMLGVMLLVAWRSDAPRRQALARSKYTSALPGTPRSISVPSRD